MLATAAIHGGTEPDLLDEVAWWQADDFWQYALYAAVAYIRAAASRVGVPVRQACQWPWTWASALATRRHSADYACAFKRRREGQRGAQINQYRVPWVAVCGWRSDRASIGRPAPKGTDQ